MKIVLMMEEAKAKTMEMMDSVKGFVNRIIRENLDVSDNECVEMSRFAIESMKQMSELAEQSMEIAIEQQKTIDEMQENIARMTALMAANNELLGLIEKNSRPVEAIGTINE